MDLDIAKLEAILAGDEFRILYNNTKFQVQSAFIKVLAAKGKIQLNTKSLERALIQFEEVSREKGLGLNTHLEVLKVASKLKEIKLALIKAKNEYYQSIHDLKLVLNLDYSVNLLIEGDLFQDFLLKKPKIRLKNLIHKARLSRPEILKSKANLRRFRKELALAEDYWIPKVSLDSYVSRSGDTLPVRD